MDKDRQFEMELLGGETARSIYRFDKIPGGFRVWRNKVSIDVVVKHGLVTLSGLGDHIPPTTRCLVDSRRLLYDLCGTFLRQIEWRDPTHRYISRWAVVKAAKCIAHRFYRELDELVDEESRMLLQMQKKMYALSGSITEQDGLRIAKIVREPEDPMIPVALRCPTFIQDVLKYRAAAALIVLVRRPPRKPETMVEMFSWLPSKPDEFKTIGTIQHAEEAWFTFLDSAPDWKGLYSHNGTAYPALTKTLMNLPGKVPVRLLEYLKARKLERPIKDRVELIFYLAYEQALVRHGRQPVNRHLVMHARRQDILAALQAYIKPRLEWLGQQPGYDFRQARAWRRLSKGAVAVNIIDLAEHISDYPHPFKGRVLGLLKAAEKWHTDEEQSKLRVDFDQAGYQKLLPRLTTGAVPEIPGLSLIETVGGLWEEGEKMHHCIRSYLDDCLKGCVEIYHISHAGQEATGLICANGSIVVHGQNNGENEACDFGRKVLEEATKHYVEKAYELARPIANDDLPF